MSLSLPSDSRIVTNRSICDLGSASRMIEGSRDCCRVAEREVASVSCSINNKILHQHSRLVGHSLMSPDERTLPGAKRLTPDEKGANLISTFSRALGLKGAEGGVGLGP